MSIALLLYCVHRALYNSLPFPVWNGDLAPEYTLMMPVTHRSVSAYQAAIPAINPAAGGNAGAGVGAGASRQAGTPLGSNATGGATVNPLQQQVQASGPGASASGPIMTAGVDAQHQERPDERSSGNSSGSAGIEMGSMPSSMLQSVLGSLRGASGSGAQGGAGARGTAAYRRLEDQSSSHGGAEDSEV
jgi:hypothetical protein